MLHQMRNLAKYVWLLVAIAFVGGFLLYQTSGLLGRNPITPTTPVAVVNGHDILYTDYQNEVQQAISQEQEREGRTLTLDDTRKIQNDVFNRMVVDVLLDQEYRRRGITVTDDEIIQYARYAPPQWITQAPELQTNGVFDPDKYVRWLSSSSAREEGLLLRLEDEMRAEIPERKLFDQVTDGVYITDAELWQAYRDAHDSATVSFIAFRPQPGSPAGLAISDNELRAYFDSHKDEFRAPGRAIVSLLIVPRLVTAADTAAARDHALKLRAQILAGAKFEDIAKSESSDSASAVKGGDLGKAVKGQFVPEFEKAAYALKAGEISQPVLSPYGFHLIRLDSRKGDTLWLHHILIPIQASDSATARVDRRADSLSNLAGSAEEPAKFDTAAKTLGLTPQRLVVTEDQPAMANGHVVPSVSAWAFGGAHPGETSELFDDDAGYYMARLDTVVQASATPDFAVVKEAVRQRIDINRQLDSLMKVAAATATAASATTLDAAAAQHRLTVEHAGPFTRQSFATGLGEGNEAVGAAFALPIGAISDPVRTDNGVFVLRVDKRTLADSAKWLAQKSVQRQQRMQAAQEQQFELFMSDLHDSAKIDDRRQVINSALRRQSS